MSSNVLHHELNMKQNDATRCQNQTEQKPASYGICEIWIKFELLKQDNKQQEQLLKNVLLYHNQQGSTCSYTLACSRLIICRGCCCQEAETWTRPPSCPPITGSPSLQNPVKWLWDVSFHHGSAGGSMVEALNSVPVCPLSNAQVKHFSLTFLLFPVFLHISSSQQGEDDARLRVDADSRDQHPAGALHHVGTWTSQPIQVNSAETSVVQLNKEAWLSELSTANLTLPNKLRS